MGDDAPFLLRTPRMDPPPEPVPAAAAEPRPQAVRMAPRPAVFGDRAANLRALDPDHPRLVPVRERYHDGTDDR